VSTKQINTSFTDFPLCDVCGRTVLRGERVSTYLNGSARRSVCELCETRALHEGWVREGNLPKFESGRPVAERRRSIFGRRRPRREGSATQTTTAAIHESSAAGSWAGTIDGERLGGAGQAGLTRHVHAVPSSDGQRVAKAVELFNGCEHCRTVAGVARSLGQPVVSVSAVEGSPSLVSVVVSWELCWYRYEIDLSGNGSGVRLAAQGYELDALDAHELAPNAVADELGRLALQPSDTGNGAR
jgi:hypothetical protein